MKKDHRRRADFRMADNQMLSMLISRNWLFNASVQDLFVIRYPFVN